MPVAIVRRVARAVSIGLDQIHAPIVLRLLVCHGSHDVRRIVRPHLAHAHVLALEHLRVLEEHGARFHLAAVRERRAVAQHAARADRHRAELEHHTLDGVALQAAHADGRTVADGHQVVLERLAEGADVTADAAAEQPVHPHPKDGAAGTLLKREDQMLDDEHDRPLDVHRAVKGKVAALVGADDAPLHRGDEAQLHEVSEQVDGGVHEQRDADDAEPRALDDVRARRQRHDERAERDRFVDRHQHDRHQHHEGVVGVKVPPQVRRERRPLECLLLALWRGRRAHNRASADAVAIGGQLGRSRRGACAPPQHHRRAVLADAGGDGVRRQHGARPQMARSAEQRALLHHATATDDRRVEDVRTLLDHHGRAHRAAFASAASSSSAVAVAVAAAGGLVRLDASAVAPHATIADGDQLVLDRLEDIDVNAAADLRAEQPVLD
mmetsp:Transcript_84836/g.254372  ORF Transcript_84836/g.254372 Transcript_84836/m.254372 type:complete len:439 (+) Transcript_84836:118-1434(+)